MQVVKLGGSVLTRETIGNNVINLIRQVQEPAVFVVSALKGITDYLADSFADRSIFKNPNLIADTLVKPYLELAERYLTKAGIRKRFELASEQEHQRFVQKALSHTHDTRAFCLSSGERLSALLVAGLILEYSASNAERPNDFPALPCIFPEDTSPFAKQSISSNMSNIAEARLNRPAVLGKTLTAMLAHSPIIAFPGFYAVDQHGSFVLFGRGGSDYSAIAIACALRAGCILCKDTGTFLSADPGLVSATKAVTRVSYCEAASLAKGGAKILHRGAIVLAKRHRIPICIADAEGNTNTIVCDTATPECSIKSISTRSRKNLAELSIVGEGITRESSLVIQALQTLFAQSIIPRSLSFDRLGHTIRIFVSGDEASKALRVLHRKLVEEKGLA